MENIQTQDHIAPRKDRGKLIWQFLKGSKAFFILCNKDSDKEHMRRIKPPCAVMKSYAKDNVSDDPQSNREDPCPVFFKKAEAHVEKKVQKDNARHVPDVGMPCIVGVDFKRGIDVERYFSYVPEEDIYKHRKA